MRRSAWGAFTLVELLIVIIVVAVLAAVVVPRFADSGLRSKEAALKHDLRQYRSIIARYLGDTGLYPRNGLDLTRSTPAPSGVNSAGALRPLNGALWHGPYLQTNMKDPVSGNWYNYSLTPPNVGRVRSSAPGNATDGTPYSSW